MGRTAQPLTLSSAVVALCVACGNGEAWAQPTSHEEAVAVGDPAASAPSFKDDAHGAVFRGKPVSEAAILSRDLACLAVRGGPQSLLPLGCGP